ncbi:MAG TPA: carboxypeptidase regulatory-like domain-containing protein, partial [Kofleriaceae bacterium]|nr:carboxypeptidase regulatory-like domain-containing protein [Kofleriaceae bacterium]
SIGGNDVATAISQRDGSFILDDLALGVIVPYASPYQVRTPTSVVVDRTDPSDITIEVAPKGTIRGRVTRHHVPVAGARVSCSFNDYCSAFTDEDGAYTLEGVPDGTGYLDAGSAKAWTSHHPVTVTAGQSQTIDLELEDGGEIRGSVVDEVGAPVPGVYVRFLSTAITDECQSMTDAAGAFDCPTLVGRGDYQPAVFPSPDRQQAYRAASGSRLDPVHVADGDAVVSDVHLAIKLEHLTIRGKVVDETGAVVADAHVTAGGTDPGFLPISARADVDGGFVVENLASGTYTLRAHAAGGSEAEVAGIATGATDVRIVIVRAGRIEGTLVGFTAPPHVYAEELMADLDVPHEALVTGSTFTFAGLPSGTYTIDAVVAGVQLGGAPAEVRSGVTTHVTLRVSARTTVDGRITDLTTGAPIAGAMCFAFVSVAGTEPAIFGEMAPCQLSDAAGHFTVDAAVGRVRIHCGLGTSGYTGVGGDFDVPGPTHVEVFGVKQIAPPSQVGFRLAEYTLPNTVVSADANTGLVVGDQLAAVDGISVANLLSGTAMAIAQNHRPGSSLVLQILRGGTPMTIAIAIH